jgi:outer membrane receptor protein involved in Fe transport
VLQVDGSYQTKTVVSDSGHFNIATQTVFPSSALPGYGTANARVEFNDIKGKGVNLALWIRNFTDEEYYTAGNDQYNAASGRSVRLIGPPRTYGVDLRYQF